MKLRQCLELGKVCGLETVEECYNNVSIHSSSLFKYEDAVREVTELHQDINKFALSLPVTLVIELMNEKEKYEK